MPELTLVADGLAWPESPRWRDGWLWLSDVHNFRLMRLDGRGGAQTVAHVPGRPAGMGFTPDGRLLLATALDRQLLWVGGNGSLSPAADLKGITKSLLNDMVVDSKGRAWVGDTGFAFGSGEPEKPGALLVFDETNGARVAAENIQFPNGVAITTDEKTLYLAETFGNRITVFDIGADGALSNRRVHATLEIFPGWPVPRCRGTSLGAAPVPEGVSPHRARRRDRGSDRLRKGARYRLRSWRREPAHAVPMRVRNRQFRP